MIVNRLIPRMAVALVLIAGCALNEGPQQKTGAQSLITTPVSYYSTPKARYLGGKYKENLDRLVERISRDPKTAPLQFANNIASTGGIGFFTHSAAKTTDERFLEVVVAVPDTFEIKGNTSAKVSRLFSLYGTELLSLLIADTEMFQERELSGYGLNFSWRNLVGGGSGARVTLERAVAYLPKEKVRQFLKREMDQNKLLNDAVIFAVEEDGPMDLVSYQPQEAKPEARAPIREENLAAPRSEAEARPAAAKAPEQRATAHAVGQDKPAQPAPTDKRETATPAVAPEPVLEEVATGEPVALLNNEVSSQETSRVTSREPTPAAEPVQVFDPKPQEIELAKAFVEPIATPATAASEAPAASGSEPKYETPAASAAASQDEPPAVQQTPVAAPSAADDIPAVPEKPAPSIIAKDESPVQPEPVVLPVAKEETREAIASGPAAAEPQPTQAALPQPTVTASEVKAVSPPPVAVDTKKAAADPTPQKIALNKSQPLGGVPEKKIPVAKSSKPLEGYIIQVAFGDRDKAQSAAQSWTRRGYTVSLTEAGKADALRLRVGNFASREDAERQLRVFRQEGLSGIVLNLPQAYRPQADLPETAASVGSESVAP